MELTTFDFLSINAGTQEQRTRIGEALVDQLTIHGFIKLTNHGLSDINFQKLISLSKEFFSHSTESKSFIANPPGPNPQRGWTGIGVESTSRLTEDRLTSKLSDAKEHYDMGPPGDREFPNRWLDDSVLPEFRSFFEPCHELCEGICLQIVSALELGLHQPSGSLNSLCVPNASDLRLNHYPTAKAKELRTGLMSRISPHTDFGIISLLLQDSVGGLEIQDRRRPTSFIPVPPNSNEMIVNMSNTLQGWTNDVLLAGVHRVAIPVEIENGDETDVPERFSMAYFFKARR